MRLPLILALLLALALAGCGSDDPATPPAPDPTAVQFSDYAAAIAAVVPPEFQGTTKSDKVVGDYSMWTEGQYPILGKAIGSAENGQPMSLYRNLNELQWAIELLEQFAALGEGEFSLEGPDSLMYAVTVAIDDLVAPVVVPVECRAVIGADEIALERVYKLTVPDVLLALHLGYAQTDTSETVVTWQDDRGEGTAFSVATKNLLSGEISIRGALYKVVEQETASWIYDIATAGDGNTEFVYNMAWYSSNCGGEGCLSCVNGRGDKNVRFGLRYHNYNAPWTRGEYIQAPCEQLFGPVGDNPYADLNQSGNYPAEYGNLIDEASMYVYGDMPHGLFESPFGQ
jgi:hypothetical protein